MPAASRCCASATNEPMSLSSTLHWMVMNRWYSSRVICRGPVTTRMSASSDRGIRSPRGPATRMSNRRTPS